MPSGNRRGRGRPSVFERVVRDAEDDGTMLADPSRAQQRSTPRVPTPPRPLQLAGHELAQSSPGQHGPLRGAVVASGASTPSCELGRYVAQAAEHVAAAGVLHDISSELESLAQTFLGDTEGMALSATYKDEGANFGKSGEWVQQHKRRLAAIRDLLEREQQVAFEVIHQIK